MRRWYSNLFFDTDFVWIIPIDKAVQLNRLTDDNQLDQQGRTETNYGLRTAIHSLITLSLNR